MGLSVTMMRRGTDGRAEREGEVRLDGTRVVVEMDGGATAAAARLARWQRTGIRGPQGDKLVPGDGERFLRALPAACSGSAFWCTPVRETP